MYKIKLVIFQNSLLLFFIFTFQILAGFCQESQLEFEQLEKYFVREISDTLFSEFIEFNERLSVVEKTASQLSNRHYNIWVIQPDGKVDPAPLTLADSWDCYMPRCSRQANQIAYISTRTGVKKLWLMQGDGTGKKQLTKGDANDEYPLWSPDGTKIAFVRGSSLFWVDVATEVEEQLTHNSIVLQPCAWSRDGSRILLTSREGDNKIELLEYIIKDQELIHVESQIPDLYKIFSNLRLHPIKDLIVFEKIEMGSHEVIVRNLDSKRQIYLSEAYSHDQHPDWSANGTLIIFSSNREIPKIEGLDR